VLRGGQLNLMWFHLRIETNTLVNGDAENAHGHTTYTAMTENIPSSVSPFFYDTTERCISPVHAIHPEFIICR